MINLNISNDYIGEVFDFNRGLVDRSNTDILNDLAVAGGRNGGRIRKSESQYGRNGNKA
jgi:hypothetical protein